MAPKAVILGTGPGEIWSGPVEIKDAYTHFFADFDKGQQDFSYHVHFGGLSAEMGWLMASDEGKGKIVPTNLCRSIPKAPSPNATAGSPATRSHSSAMSSRNPI